MENNIFHIKIKQGRLLPNGKIEGTSQHWVGLPVNPETVVVGILNTVILNQPILPFKYVLVGNSISLRRCLTRSLEILDYCHFSLITQY